MSRFIFEMPDDMAALVEAYRVKRGHKATAIAVRELISTGIEVAGQLIGPIEVTPQMAAAARERAAAPTTVSTVGKSAARTVTVTGKSAERKVVSRLKGEWKAP